MGVLTLYVSEQNYSTKNPCVNKKVPDQTRFEQSDRGLFCLLSSAKCLDGLIVLVKIKKNLEDSI